MRVGIAACDVTVANGLRHVFTRRGDSDVIVLRPPERAAEQVDAGGDPCIDLLVVDVWPASAASAERSCAEWHARHPRAAMVAVVHYPTDWLRARLKRLGCSDICAKESVRELPELASALAVCDLDGDASVVERAT